MEFLAGIIATLLVGAAVYFIRKKRQERKDRSVQATRRSGPYPDHNPDKR